MLRPRMSQLLLASFPAPPQTQEHSAGDFPPRPGLRRALLENEDQLSVSGFRHTVFNLIPWI